jgi:hypothetical protein
MEWGGGTDVYFLSFLFSALDWGQCLDLRSGGCNPAENISSNFKKKAFMSPRSSLGHFGLYKIPWYFQGWNAVRVFFFYFIYFNTFILHFLLFCTVTNTCTTISQIITLLHVSTLSCHPQGACNQYLAKIHEYENLRKTYAIYHNFKLYYQQLHLKYLCNLARYWLQAP